MPQVRPLPVARTFLSARDSDAAVPAVFSRDPDHLGSPEVTRAIALYERELGIPATDALSRPSGRLVDMVLDAFPSLYSAQHPGQRSRAGGHSRVDGFTDGPRPLTRVQR